MNFAGVFQAPVVFFCLNNQWAISLPRAKQSRARTLAQKAIAYGFPGSRWTATTSSPATWRRARPSSAHGGARDPR